MLHVVELSVSVTEQSEVLLLTLAEHILVGNVTFEEDDFSFTG